MIPTPCLAFLNPRLRAYLFLSFFLSFFLMILACCAPPQVLDSALNDLLSHPDWGKFDTCLSYFSWPEEGKAEVLGQHRAWVLRREEIAKRRKAEAQAVPREAEGRLEEDGVGAEV